MTIFFILIELAFLFKTAPPSERVCFRKALSCFSSCARLPGEAARERCSDTCFDQVEICLD